MTYAILDKKLTQSFAELTYINIHYIFKQYIRLRNNLPLQIIDSSLSISFQNLQDKYIV